MKKYARGFMGLTLLLTLAANCNDPGPKTLFATTTLPTNSMLCPYGGSLIQSGTDKNNDGTLSADEIENEFPICNGQDGLNTLTLSEIYQGEECGVRGGVTYHSGLDTNRNNILEVSERTDSAIVCNGSNGNNGFNGLVRSEDVPAAVGGECQLDGGYRFFFGVDLNGNNILDPTEEVSSATKVICNGRTPIIETSNLEPGEECELGGLSINVGFEVDGLVGLLGSEIVTTTNFCNRRIDGANSVVRFTVIPTGTTTCPYGGNLFEVGRDRNANNVLETSEVEHARAVCNGNSAGVTIVTVPIGDSVCEFGGREVRSGVDSNGDGSITGAEIEYTSKICSVAVNSNRTLINYQAVAVGSSTCQWGGIRTNVGVDDGEGAGAVANDGILQSSEVDSTAVNCNQVSLLSGNNARVETSPASLSDCPFGGIRVRTGTDTNRNNALDFGEYTTNYICNGHDAHEYLIFTDEFSTLSQCGGTGGVRLRSGLDSNDNTVLDTSEVMRTSYVCDGLDGLDGLDGIDGVDGFVGYDGRDSLIRIVGDGGACGDANGFAVNVGLDLNENGSLDSSEVTDSEVVCDGYNGFNTLVETTEDSFYCEFGGIIVKSGQDYDEDNYLDTSEITSTSTICF